MDSTCLCIEQTNNVVVAIAIATNLSEPEAYELLDELKGCIRYDGAQFIVLDMAEVQRINSACLDVPLTLFQELEHVRGHVALANCQP